jgi:sporulation protein YlmC with PRC-barrel domain
MQWTKSFVASFAIPALMLATTTYTAQGQQPTSQTQETQQPRMEQTQAPSSSVYRTSDIMDADVKNPQGEDLGKISDVVIDPVDGNIVYAVLAAGGFLGLGEKYFAVPWTAFQPQVDQEGEIEQLTLDVNKEKLENAQGFDKNTWPNMANPEWGQGTHAYYGQQDAWERRQAMRQAGETTGMSQQAGMAATVQNIRGNTVELQVPQGLVEDLQAGDRVEVNIRKQAQTQSGTSTQPSGAQERQESKEDMKPKN